MGKATIQILCRLMLLLLVIGITATPLPASAYNPPPIMDAPNSWYTSTTITLLPVALGYSGSVSDSISPRGDIDTFKFSVIIAGDLTVSIQAPTTMKSGGINPRLVVELYGTDTPSFWQSKEVPVATSGNLGPVIISTGLYWLRVRERDDAGWDNGESVDPYKLVLNHVPLSTGNDRAPDSWYRATLIPPTKICTDTIARKGDRDIWRFDVTGSGSLGVDVTAPTTMRTDAANPRIVVGIFGPNSPSTIVEGEVNVGSTGTVNAPGTVVIGTYWLRVYERDAGGNDRGESPSPYTLQITGTATVVPDYIPSSGDIGAPTAYTSNYYSVGTAITDSITPVGDQDWYKFPINVLGELNVSITAPTAGSGIRVRFYNPDVGSMTYVDVAMGGTGTLGPISVWSWTFGGYFLQVTEYDADGENNEVTGPYTLNLIFTPAPGGNDIPENWYIPRIIEIGETASNTIQPRYDDDYFAFMLPDLASQYEVKILCTAPSSMRTFGGINPKVKLLLYGPNSPSPLITTATVDVGSTGMLGPIIVGPGLYWITIRETDSLGDHGGESNSPYTILVTYRTGRTNVSLKLNQLAYKQGDSMNAVFHIENTEATTLTFEWWLSVPQYNIVMLWISVNIPSGLVADIPFTILTIGNWGSSSFYAVWVLVLKDGSGNIKAWDTTYWIYQPL